MIFAAKDIPNRRKACPRHVTDQVHRDVPRLHRRAVPSRADKRCTIDVQCFLKNILEDAHKLVRWNRANRMSVNRKWCDRGVIRNINQRILGKVNRDRLTRTTRHRKQAHQCTLKRTDRASHTLGDVLKNIQWHHMSGLIAHQLRLQNRNPQLEFRRCKLSNHPGRKARPNAFIHPRQVTRRTVTCNHQCTTGLLQRIECVEEFFDGSLAAT